MSYDKIVEYTRILVDITIQKHKEGLLGKEKMSKFIKNNLTTNIKGNDYDKILHLYNKYLANEGYEIKNNINKFDIIDFNSNEYQIYISKLYKN